MLCLGARAGAHGNEQGRRSCAVHTHTRSRHRIAAVVGKQRRSVNESSTALLVVLSLPVVLIVITREREEEKRFEL